MGRYDSAQIADLVVFYILNTLSRIVDPIQIGLYRDDSTLYIPNSDGPKCYRIKKNIIRVFKIEISSNIKTAKFLGVTLTSQTTLADRSLK